MKKSINFFTSRSFVISFLIFVQILILILGIFFLSKFFVYLYGLFFALSILISIIIVIKEDNPMYKLAWVLPILIFPLFGGVFYLFFGKHNISPSVRKYLKNVYAETLSKNQELNQNLEEIKKNDKNVYKQFKYVQNVCMQPVYKNTYTKFLSPGEKKFEFLIEELKKAKKFIFLEYFIIKEGKMWNSILEILIYKVKQGVDVRLIYDDVGSINTLPNNYNEQLKKYGIKVEIFNQYKPLLDTFMNYRDHRKIAIIDGNIGFTGGINLADEYININSKLGYWKDACIYLKGDAVWSLTVMFLQLWSYQTKNKENFNKFKPTIKLSHQDDMGYVQIYDDNPLDKELTSESIYLNIINSAKDYIYIGTPYLIIDNEMMTALCLAAKSNIDVRIVTPNIADKWFVHEVTKSNYSSLIKSGVKIYEFTPGFIHSKTIVVDDKLAIVGSANFDFRSFFLQFEAGVFLYASKSVLELKTDYKQNIIKKSKLISIEDCNNISILKKFIMGFLRLFAPLM